MKHQLPENFAARQARIEDLPEIHRMEGLKTLHYQGKQGLTLDLLMSSYQTPGFQPDKSVLLIENQDGILVALIEVWDMSNPPIHPFIWMTVDPAYEGLGLEDYLLKWAEIRAQQAVNRVDPELRVAIRCNPLSLVKSASNALLGAGWTPIRHNFTMRIDMAEVPPGPDWPEGIELKPYDPDKHARQVYELDEEVFQDHFGYVPDDPETGYERFMHHMTGDDSYDPGLWYLAYAGEEMVAICICRRTSFEDPEAGHVSTLGVKRDWRRQGIAQALLLHAFGEFYRRGTVSVDLGVDAESLTGATDLYKKVGMHVHMQYDMHEKVLREGLDISVNQLEEVAE
jgi:ribosomal protein S18 acetylase RimI-like enzyme